jgi:hypothetical protein
MKEQLNSVSPVSRVSDHGDSAGLNHLSPPDWNRRFNRVVTVVTQNSRLPPRSALSEDRLAFGFG